MKLSSFILANVVAGAFTDARAPPGSSAKNLRRRVLNEEVPCDETTSSEVANGYCESIIAAGCKPTTLEEDCALLFELYRQELGDGARYLSSLQSSGTRGLRPEEDLCDGLTGKQWGQCTAYYNVKDEPMKGL